MGMDTVELIVAIENHFGIQIPDQEASEIYRIKDIYYLVAKYTSPAKYSHAEITRSVNNIIVEFTGLKPGDIKLDATITGDLRLD